MPEMSEKPLVRMGVMAATPTLWAYMEETTSSSSPGGMVLSFRSMDLLDAGCCDVVLLVAGCWLLVTGC